MARPVAGGAGGSTLARWATSPASASGDDRGGKPSVGAGAGLGGGPAQGRESGAAVGGGRSSGGRRVAGSDGEAAVWSETGAAGAGDEGATGGAGDEEACAGVGRRLPVRHPPTAAGGRRVALVGVGVGLGIGVVGIGVVGGSAVVGGVVGGGSGSALADGGAGGGGRSGGGSAAGDGPGVRWTTSARRRWSWGPSRRADTVTRGIDGASLPGTTDSDRNGASSSAPASPASAMVAVPG